MAGIIDEPEPNPVMNSSISIWQIGAAGCLAWFSAI
jgi:hypothetical protein